MTGYSERRRERDGEERLVFGAELEDLSSLPVVADVEIAVGPEGHELTRPDMPPLPAGT